MSLCSYCSKIPLNLFSYGAPERTRYLHHSSYNALEASTHSGCTMCKLLLQAMSVYKRQPVNETASWKEDVPATLHSSKFYPQGIGFGDTFRGEFRGAGIPDDWLEYCNSQSTYSNSDDLALYEARLIQRWTDVCLKTHTKCGHSSGFLPTRLIDVGVKDNVNLSLVLSADMHFEDRRYLALSHCWGLTMPDTARTVTASLEKNKTSIQEDELTRTFRDFIHIARRLGIQYVWIDSLCIIQDDGDDWEKEATMMASVYSNAYLTIAASNSTDGTGGCAVLNSERSIGPVDVDCLVENSDLPPEFVPTKTSYKFRIWTRLPSTTGMTDEPLQTRGWTMQERELSPRVVNYCKDTIRWECRSLHASLEFPWNDGLSFTGVQRTFDKEQLIFFPMPGVNGPTESLTDSRTKKALAWMKLIKRYTSRNLTKSSDTLPAISGVARTIADSTSDEYFAGLWKSNFHQCLLWKSDWRTDQGLQTHTKPLQNAAPSWSWASMRGKVAWHMGEHSSYNPDPNPEFVPTILDILITPLRSDPYGQLKQGILHMEGKVAMAFSVSEEENGTGNPQHRKLKSPVGSQEIGLIHYDIPLCIDCAPPGKLNLVFLMCCLDEKKRDYEELGTCALALQPVLDSVDGIPGTMRRVGLASRIKPDFWRSPQYNSVLMTLKIC